MKTWWWTEEDEKDIEKWKLRARLAELRLKLEGHHVIALPILLYCHVLTLPNDQKKYYRIWV